MKATSFICEHTAEYVLVPKVVEILSRSHARVVPFYYWATREGATLSRSVGPRSRIRLLSIYPRRPKFTEPGGGEIIVRFNDILFEAASKSEPLGIPVFAGVPLASSLEELGGNTSCAWFRIAGLGRTPATIDIRLGLGGELLGSYPSTIEGPISDKAFAERVDRLSRPLEWPEVPSIIRLTRSRDTGYWPFGFGSYKPFYVLLTCGEQE